MSSRVIDSLKSVKEVLPDNYTSRQLLGTLDYLILQAIRPIIVNTTYVDRVLAVLAGWLVSASRRKISAAGTRDQFQSLVMAFCITTDADQRLKIWSALKLERTLSFFIIEQWLQRTADYATAVSDGDHAAVSSIMRSACVVNRSALFQKQQTIAFWQQHALKFKEALLEKYMRKVVNESVAFHKMREKSNPSLVTELDDVAQNFMLTVSKAIDKCDTDRGTLTSYIQLWLKDAMASSYHSHEYGTAFTLPVGKRREVARSETRTLSNIAVSIDAEEVQQIESDQDIEADSIRAATIERVRRLAKAVDPQGLGRLALGIQELLSPEQIAVLQSVAQPSTDAVKTSVRA